MIRIIATMLFTLSAVMLYFLGWQYDNVGWGLNPMAAYPLATLVLFTPIAFQLRESS